MGTWKAEKEYSCFNDCKQSGCPKHKMEVRIQTTADYLSVYEDGKLLFSCDPEEWNTLKSILKEWNYTFFNLS